MLTHTARPAGGSVPHLNKRRAADRFFAADVDGFLANYDVYEQWTTEASLRGDSTTARDSASGARLGNGRDRGPRHRAAGGYDRAMLSCKSTFREKLRSTARSGSID